MLEIGDIVKVKDDAVKSGFINCNIEDRFEIISIDSYGSWTRTVHAKLIGYVGDGLDAFPYYVLEKA